LHTIFSLYKDLKGRWGKAKAIWKKMIRGKIMPRDVFNATKETPQQDLLKVMQQEPLITPWWTIGVLACKAQRYLPLFIKMAKGVRTMTYEYGFLHHQDNVDVIKSNRKTNFGAI
jgi:hypothetical protein